MPAMERESSRDRSPAPRQQHGFSFSEGRLSVPMWDSSDPERAPPPLPLNPTTGTPTTKANTSAGIAAAAKQIVEKARESAPISSYTTNGPRDSSGSPEKSLVKGAHHKRMQSLQTGHVKDLRSYLDNNRSPDRSPERPESRGSLLAYSRMSSMDNLTATPERSLSPAPAGRDTTKETPTIRPSTRPTHRAILGENTPPSATMLALQTMQVPDPPLNDITNGPSTPNGSRPFTGLDFSSQLLNLTTIATNLQKEMSQLSRRSKDNATDLIKLQDATNQRDEDIRKSLRELSKNVSSSAQGLLGPPPLPNSNRSPSNFSAPNITDGKVFGSPESTSKYHVPRAASAHSFLDADRCGSPSPYSVEGAASVAMLEKIIREMVTKDGQERLLSTLSELLDKSRKENVTAAKKVEELSEFIREKSESQALVHVRNADGGAPRLDMNFGSPRDFAKSVDKPTARDGPGNEELIKLLNRIKDSVAHSGGTSSEVKGLVRDLRGEVLGMGRELGKKLDQIGETSLTNSLDRSIVSGKDFEHYEEVQRVVEEGMAELKQHLSGVLRERAEQDDNTFRQLATARSGPSEDEMLSVVKHALAEHGGLVHKRESDVESIQNHGLDRDGVLDAVKEGLKDFEPNIELQQFGLERDEILAVLKEGFEDFQNSRSEPPAAVIDKGELFEVLQESLKDFQTPFPAQQFAQVKEELISNVREALSGFTPPPAASMDHEMMHAAVLEAVREGLVNHGPAAPREIEISREDLFDAVKASLDGSTIPFGGFGEQVLSQLRELIDGMRLEFKQYSAANGRDTEQVLDATKDGLESLRREIESYVDRAQDVTGKDEIIETVKTGLEQVRLDVLAHVSTSSGRDAGTPEMLDYIKAEFEHLHEAVTSNDTSRDIGGSSAVQNTAVIMAVQEGMDDLKAHLGHRSGDAQSNDEIYEVMREEFEQLKGSLLNAHATDKSELIETIQDSMGALHMKLNGSDLGHSSGGATEEVIQAMREEMGTLKETIHSMVLDAEKDAVVAGVREALNDLRAQLSQDHEETSAEMIAAFKEELDTLKDSLGGSVATSRGIDNPEAHIETLHELQTTLEEVKAAAATTSGKGLNDEQLEAFMGEFETLRTSIRNRSSNEEVLDAVRLGLDDLRSALEKKLDNPEQAMSHQNEVLDALNDGLDGLRTDIVKTLDKPMDMTVNYEILDTLKDGLATLRSELDKLTGDKSKLVTGEIVLADGGEVGTSREIGPDGEVRSAEASEKNPSVETIEVLLAQLQIKVEAMNQTIQDMPTQQQATEAPEGMAMKDDLAVLGEMLKDVQENVLTLAARQDPTAPESAARKEDTDAIETLLRNTKSQLEEMTAPDFASMASKEHVDEVHASVRAAHDTIVELADKLDNDTACKADVAVVEVLASDIKSLMEEVKEKMASPPAEAESKPDLMTKADLDVLGVMCVEIKERVKEMVLPDPDDMPSKAELEQLQGLINDFRESHDKMKDSYETDIAVTAKAFDDRKQEHEDTVTQLSEVKELIDEVRSEVLDKLNDEEVGLTVLGGIVKGLEEKSNNEDVISEVKDVLDKVKEEFERAHESLGAIKVDHAQAAESSLEKQSEHREAVVSELGGKLDLLFDGLMSKYDDAQQAAEDRAKAFEDKATQQEEMLTTMKALADELKLSIDTLGSTMTTFMGDLPAQVEKMAEDHKTVFDQVIDTRGKLDEVTEDLKGEHTATRDEVAKVLAAVDVVQSDMSEHHPRFMVTLEEVRALINSHYEHSQKSSETAAEQAQAVRDLQDALKAGFQDSKSHHEELKTCLPALMPPSVETTAPAQYDDREVHEKLDKLMGHVEEASSRSGQLERLDLIHEKVMTTAAEVSAFVAAQNKQISDDHAGKEKEAEEIALLLERRLERKDQLEADITVLNEEKESLAHAVEALKAEKEALAAQKARLNVDVSSLETALHIRRDELHAMDDKAAAIERRMLEGVMNQSRMLLLAKTSRPPSPVKKKPQGRDLRVPSNASAASAQTVTSSVPALKANHALAMKSRGGLQGAMPNTAERRIMSLNQINHNVPTGANGFAAVARPGLTSGGVNSMKRSHSVKQPFSTRKPSWGSKRNVSMSSYNKENETLSEEDEEEEFLSRPGSSRGGDAETPSEMGTERRTSYMSSGTGSMTYATGSYLDGPETDDGRYAPSEGSYLTGSSYMTGSEIDHRTSLGSSANGVLGVQSSAINEEPDAELGAEEEEEEVGELRPILRLEAPPVKKEGIAQHFAPPSDSGLGTDLPTANLSGGEEYFK